MTPILLLALLQPPAPRAPLPLVPPVADTGVFSPIRWTPPSRERSASGSAGAGYWQQKADYRIRATLDTAAKRLDGTVTLTYTNRSADTLRFVWLQLDQNLFAPGSTGSLLFQSQSRFGGGDFAGGFEVTSVTQRAVAAPGARPGAAATLTLEPRGTMGYLALKTPLAPGARTELTFVYGFKIPEHGADRMGREGSLYELAQWYPRLAVYDDQHGWNTDPYLGQGEFYLEYGDIDYEVTVPAGYIVGGSGTLQNPLEVLTATQRARLAQAARSDTTIAIITEAELTSGAARPRKEGTLTWKFRAPNVRDVAWAAAPDFLWDACAWEGILAHAYYRPSAVGTWAEAAQMNRASIKEYSTRWFRYPYPQMSAIEGPISGMEYPMVAMENRSENREALYAVVTHEIGHSWFPMIIGSDERRYAWMDEGFNTFINTFSEEGYFKRDDTARRRGEAGFVFSLDRGPTAQPIMTPANRYRDNNNLGALAYIKPSVALLMLRNKVLGPEVFDAAFREYIRRWAFKHPQPEDFFRTIENVSGKDLAWFWRSFFYTTAALDQSVESVTQATDSAGRNLATVTLRNLGAAVMPVELELTLDDGTTVKKAFPVEIWYLGDRYPAQVVTPRKVTAARVNPDRALPDLNLSNDRWTAPN